MRKIKLGGKEIEVRATTGALLFYRQAFGKSLLVELQNLAASWEGFAKGEADENFDETVLFKIIYAMHRAAKPNEALPDFEQWYLELETVDFSDKDWLEGVLEMVMDGFFRSAGSAAPPAARSKKK